MNSFEEKLNFPNYSEIEKKVDALIENKGKVVNTSIKEKRDSVDSCFALNVSLFAPMGAIYMLIGLTYSHFMIYIIGVLFLFWGTISYSIISLRNRIIKMKKFKMIN